MRLVLPTQWRLGGLKGNDQPLTMIWTKARGWSWLKVVKRGRREATENWRRSGHDGLKEASMLIFPSWMRFPGDSSMTSKIPTVGDL